MNQFGLPSERVLVLAPVGRDAAVASAILREAGLTGEVCPDLGALVAELERGAGVVVVTEEVLHMSDTTALSAWIAAQPSWSDFPFVLLTRQGGGPERNSMALRLMELLGNVTFLERPFHPVTLAAMVRMALRGRHRQYEARARLDDLRLAREAAEAAQHAAEMAGRSKSRFLAAASHDLRQPLQSLFLFAEVLSSGNLGERERNSMASIERALGALKMLLDAILDVSKLDAGIIGVERRDVPMRYILDHIAGEYSRRAAGKRLDFRVVACDAVVHTDPTLLGRILRNLVENALRYTQKGRILVGCRRRGERLLVQVTDTGIGIAPEMQQEIFEEFVQIGNRERDREQGLGLGLAIVRRMSELLGHPITVRSALGRGSTFTLDIPLVRTARGQTATLETPCQAMTQDGTRVVLVIDDDAIVLMGLVAMMNSWGQRTLSASSRAEAVELLQASGMVPDLLLADYRLRDGETGLDVIAEVRRRAGREIPAILLTGDTAPDVLRRAHARGVQLMHKPIRPHDLKRALDEAWSRTVEEI
jgi:signal transduction histidine kinase/ActR/RegA family two-component response regulator